MVLADRSVTSEFYSLLYFFGPPGIVIGAGVTFYVILIPPRHIRFIDNLKANNFIFPINDYRFWIFTVLQDLRTLTT